MVSLSLFPSIYLIIYASYKIIFHYLILYSSLNNYAMDWDFDSINGDFHY